MSDNGAGKRLVMSNFQQFLLLIRYNSPLRIIEDCPKKENI